MIDYQYTCVSYQRNEGCKTWKKVEEESYVKSSMEVIGVAIWMGKWIDAQKERGNSDNFNTMRTMKNGTIIIVQATQNMKWITTYKPIS